MTESDGTGQAVSVRARRRIGYIPEFDGLRGLAAVFVVAVHLFMVVIPAGTQLPSEITGTFVFMDLFFVLSGFLITALLLREQGSTGRVGLLGFYRRRILRLLPALYVLLAAHVVYALLQSPAAYPRDVERSTVLHAALYGLNFKMDTLFSPVAKGLTQLWSLGVEEQFYALWPLVVILVLPARRRLGVVVGILLAAIVGVALYRASLWNDSMSTNTGWLRLYTHTDTRADSLLVGALMAYLWTHGIMPSRRALQVLAWLAVPVLVWFLLDVELSDPFAYRGGFTLMAVAWSAVILACAESDWALRPLLRVRPLRVLGEVSYGIYLWHVPVMFAVKEHGGNLSATGRVLLAVGVTGLAVTLSWFLVEQPFLRLKDRLDRRQPSAPVERPAEPVADPTTAATDPAR